MNIHRDNIIKLSQLTLQYWNKWFQMLVDPKEIFKKPKRKNHQLTQSLENPYEISSKELKNKIDKLKRKYEPVIDELDEYYKEINKDGYYDG